MIIITGISGLVGGNLARALLAMGRPVKGLVHKDHRAVAGLDIQLVEGDIRDQGVLKRAFQGCDVVYHLAASISIQTQDLPSMEAINVQGTRNVVEACLHCGVKRLIHLSSIHALEQEPLSTPIDEDRPRVGADSQYAYDRSKAAAETEVRSGIERGLNAVILNPTGIIGPYDFKPSYTGKALIALAEKRLPALVNGGFDWVDVRDVVTGMIQAEKLAAPGTNYLLSGYWRSLRQIAALVSDFSQTKAPRLTLPLELAYLGLPVIRWLSKLNRKEPLYTRFSLDVLKSNRQISHRRANSDLGYQPRPFEQTIFDTLEWFENHKYIRPSDNQR
jgi:dihydroflavonol-4-reductase